MCGSLGCGQAGPHTTVDTGAAPTADAAGGDGSGCALVACSEGTVCCAGWSAFALDTAARNRAARRDLVKDHSAGPTAVLGSYLFDAAGQIGALDLKFGRPSRAKVVKVKASVTGPAPYVTLESAGGESGCAYELGVEGIAALATPRSCWGDDKSPVQHLTIRVQSLAAGPITLNVSSVTLELLAP